MRRLSASALAALGVVRHRAGAAGHASHPAHPLGNFSVNQAPGARPLYRIGSHVTAVVDLAELPTLQERAWPSHAGEPRGLQRPESATALARDVGGAA